MKPKKALPSELLEFAQGNIPERADHIRVSEAKRGWLKRLLFQSDASAIEAEAAIREKKTTKTLESVVAMYESETAMGFLSAVAKKAEKIKSPVASEISGILQSSPEFLTKRYLLNRERLLFSDQLNNTSVEIAENDSTDEQDINISPVTMLLLDAAMKTANPKHRARRVILSGGNRRRTADRYNPAVAAGLFGSEAAADQQENIDAVDLTNLKVLYNLIGDAETSPPEVPKFSAFLPKASIDSIRLNDYGLDTAINVRVAGPYQKTETGGAGAEYVHPSASAKITRFY